MARRPDPANKFIDAALSLARERPWRSVSLSDIAKGAGVPLSELYRHFPNRTAIVAAYIARTDEQVLAEDRSADAEESARDRLFDVLMARLELMAKDRPALRSIARDVVVDPLAVLALHCTLLRSAGWMLEAAGIDSQGLEGAIRRRGLLAIMTSLVPVWMREEGEDTSKTMASLDRRLEATERLVGRMSGRRFGDESAAA